MATITVRRGSVVQADTDAIVNAANERLLGGSGVCGAIFTAAGWDKMQAACDKLSPCPTGQAVATPGFALKAKWVVHTVGPVYRSPALSAPLLYSAYQSALQQAHTRLPQHWPMLDQHGHFWVSAQRGCAHCTAGYAQFSGRNPQGDSHILLWHRGICGVSRSTGRGRKGLKTP